MPETRTYIVDQDPYVSLVIPACTLGLTSRSIFHINEFDYCLVQCRSENDLFIVRTLLGNCPFALMEEGLGVPAVWRDTLVEAIEGSPYPDIAKVLSFVDLSLPNQDDHAILKSLLRHQRKLSKLASATTP